MNIIKSCLIFCFRPVNTTEENEFLKTSCDRMPTSLLSIIAEAQVQEPMRGQEGQSQLGSWRQLERKRERVKKKEGKEMRVWRRETE